MVMAGTISTYASDFANMGSAGEVMAKTTVKTLTSTLIEGEALEKSFRTALGSTFASYANGEITAEELNETVSLILTGATGAAGSAITGGDPVQGAMSAIIAELAEQIKAPELTKAQKAEAKSMAALSEFVYSDEGKVPEGFEIITAQDFEAKGIIPPTMVDEDSGFHSELFFNKETQEYALGYRGTEMMQRNDWETNFAQETGYIGKQYQLIKEQVEIIRKFIGDDTKLTATGHSLGGGLTLAAAATGLVDRAIVFNPAGLHDNTVEAMKPDQWSMEQAKAIINEVTTSYISRGDILNNLQDLLDFALPTVTGERVVVEGGGAHGIVSLETAFE
jgi:filamentous hemagglutinin